MYATRSATGYLDAKCLQHVEGIAIPMLTQVRAVYSEKGMSTSVHQALSALLTKCEATAKRARAWEKLAESIQGIHDLTMPLEQLSEGIKAGELEVGSVEHTSSLMLQELAASIDTLVNVGFGISGCKKLDGRLG